jgi:hypothetical protein
MASAEIPTIAENLPGIRDSIVYEPIANEPHKSLDGIESKHSGSVYDEAASAFNKAMEHARQSEEKTAAEMKAEADRMNAAEQAMRDTGTSLGATKCMADPGTRRRAEQSPAFQEAHLTANMIMFGFIVLGAILAAVVIYSIERYGKGKIPSYLEVPCAIGVALLAYRVGSKISWDMIKDARDTEVTAMCK